MDLREAASGELNFDLEPVEVPVRINGKRYVLREASEAAAAAFRNSAIRAARLRDGKVVGFDGIGDQQSLLLSMCLYVPGPDGRIVLLDGDPDPRTLVPIAKIRNWQSRVVKPLFDRLRQISHLEEGENPVTRELREALSLDGSPIRPDDFRSWVEGLGDEQKDEQGDGRFKALRDAVSGWSTFLQGQERGRDPGTNPNPT